MSKGGQTGSQQMMQPFQGRGAQQPVGQQPVNQYGPITGVYTGPFDASGRPAASPFQPPMDQQQSRPYPFGSTDYNAVMGSMTTTQPIDQPMQRPSGQQPTYLTGDALAEAQAYDARYGTFLAKTPIPSGLAAMGGSGGMSGGSMTPTQPMQQPTIPQMTTGVYNGPFDANGRPAPPVAQPPMTQPFNTGFTTGVYTGPFGPDGRPISSPMPTASNGSLSDTVQQILLQPRRERTSAQPMPVQTPMFSTPTLPSRPTLNRRPMSLQDLMLIGRQNG